MNPETAVTCTRHFNHVIFARKLLTFPVNILSENSRNTQSMFKQNCGVSGGSGNKSVEGRPQIHCRLESVYRAFSCDGLQKQSDYLNHIIMQATENWRQEGLGTYSSPNWKCVSETMVGYRIGQ